MKVAELARRAGVAPSAVRFYEETGVLPPAMRLVNGYREFDATDLARLRLVVVLRRSTRTWRRWSPPSAPPSKANGQISIVWIQS